MGERRSLPNLPHLKFASQCLISLLFMPALPTHSLYIANSSLLHCSGGTLLTHCITGKFH
ncbi:hypothetical protein C0J52_20271 [Blattella germanica]|nr:hypothetical protein C0J52_20271 [Blattella germanica]